MTRVSSGIVTLADGAQRRYENGKLHRVGGPAVIYASAAQRWYENGELHRVGGPAVIYGRNTQRWCENDRVVIGKRRYDARVCSYWRMVV